MKWKGKILEKLTFQKDNRNYIRELQQDEFGYYGKAIDRLAAIEDLYEDLKKQEQEIAVRLAKFHRERKTKGYMFQETLALKTLNDKLLNLLASHGIK